MHCLQDTGRDAIRGRRLAFFLLAGLAGAAVDQATKLIVFTKLGAGGESVPVVKGILSLTCRMNTGTVFGLFPDNNLVFVFLTVVAMVAIALYLTKCPSQGVVVTSLSGGMVAAGAIGNLIDRVMMGGVRDFIDLHVWPIFNGADVFICVGAAGLIFAAIAYPDEGQTEKEEADGQSD